MLGLEGEEISAIEVDPFDEDVIYAGSTSDFSLGKVGGFFKSIDSGATWDTLVRGVTVRDIDIHPSNTQIIYLTGGINYLTTFGIFKTTDGGMSWFRTDTSIHYVPEEGPGVLAIDPLNPYTLYVGTSGFGTGHLYRSKNGGLSWEKIGERDIVYGGVTGLAIDWQNSDVLYVGTDMAGAILKSTDGGAMWNRLDFPEVGIVHDLLVNPSDLDIVYAGTWRYGFYLTTNAGTTWHSTNAGLPDTVSVRRISVSPGKEIYIAGNDMRKGAVYETAQDNIEWTMIGNATFERINTIAGSKEGAIYGGATGIYMLSD